MTDSRVRARIVGLAAGLLGLGLPALAEAAPYEVFVDVDDEQDLYDLQVAGDIGSGTFDILVDLMRQLNEERGVTFVFATHDPKVMRGARRIVRLVDGQVVDDERKG